MSAQIPQSFPDPFLYYVRLKRLKEFVDLHYSEPISAPLAAKIAGLGEKYFSTFFHDKVGITFSEWMRKIRVAKAKELLSTRDMSVSQVAFEVGFNDIATFTRSFKLCENLTPSEYRKTVRPRSWPSYTPGSSSGNHAIKQNVKRNIPGIKNVKPNA